MENINVGSLPNDGNGDLLRNAFIKVNENFQELLTLIEGDAGTVALSGVTGLQTILDGIQNNLTNINEDLNSLSSDISYLSGVTSSNTSAIDLINITVNDNTNNISDIYNQINSINLTILNINDAITQLIAENIAEAPLDGNKYVRQDADWSLANFIQQSTGTTYTTNSILTLTQAEYDAIVTKNNTTLYFIV